MVVIVEAPVGGESVIGAVEVGDSASVVGAIAVDVVAVVVVVVVAVVVVVVVVVGGDVVAAKSWSHFVRLI